MYLIFVLAELIGVLGANNVDYVDLMPIGVVDVECVGRVVISVTALIGVSCCLMRLMSTTGDVERCRLSLSSK